jgi:hypothetical protein
MAEIAKIAGDALGTRLVAWMPMSPSSPRRVASLARVCPFVVSRGPVLVLVGLLGGCGAEANATSDEPVSEVASAANQVRCEFNSYNCTVPNFEKVKNKDTNRKYNDYDKSYFWDLENQPELKDGAGNVRGHVKGQARLNFGQRKKLAGVNHVYAWAVTLVGGGSASGWIREDSVHRVATIGKMPTAAPGKPDGGFYETDWVVTGGDVDAAGNLVLNAKYGNRKVNPNVTSGEAASDYLVRQWVPATKVGYVNLLYNLPGTGGMTTDTLPLCVHFKRFKAVKEVELELYFYDSAYQSDLKLHFDYGEIKGRRGWMTKELLTPASEVNKLAPNHPCRVQPPAPEPPPEPPPVVPPKPAVGVFDAANCDGLAGWSQDPDEPTKPLAASLFFGVAGQAGTTVPLAADRERADLCAPLGSCNHAFTSVAPYSLFDGAGHEVHAYGYDSGDGSAAELQASPQTFSCALPAVTGVRRWISSPDVFAEWGFDAFFDQLPLPATSADGIPEAAALPATPVLIRANDDAAVYLVDGDKKRHVTSVDSADAWHLDLATVQIKAPEEVAAITTGPALPFRPMLVSDSLQRISVVDTADATPDVPSPEPPPPPPTEPTEPGPAGSAGIGGDGGGGGNSAGAAGSETSVPPAAGGSAGGSGGAAGGSGTSGGTSAGGGRNNGAGAAGQATRAPDGAAPDPSDASADEGGCSFATAGVGMGDLAGSDRGLSWALVGALGLAAFGRRRRTI